MPLSKIQDIGNQVVPNLGRRNLIINGGMQHWQRATAATTVTPNVGTSYNTVDRFFFYEYSDGSYTTEQSTGHRSDTGHENAIKCVCTGTDTSLAATQFASVSHRIEAQNLQHLRYGTSSAKTLTCSFWVRSNKTGIYSFSLVKNDGTAHYFVSEYTINTADTWEQKTISIPVLTGSSINNDNGVGFSIEWSLAYGSQFRTSTLNQWMTASDFSSSNQINWLDSTSNNWYLTGVQLEVGDTATEFEHRSFAEELQLCQRYYTKSWAYGSAVNTNPGVITAACVGNVNRAFGNVFWPTEMRAAPTVTWYSGAAATVNKWRNGSQGTDINPPSPLAAIGTKGYGYVLSSGISGVTDSLQGHYEASTEL